MTGDRVRVEIVAVLANMATAALGAAREQPVEDHGVASGSGGDGVCAPVESGSGARQHRVDRPAVRPGRRGGRVGLAPVGGLRYRRGPGPVGPHRGGPGRVPGTGVAGVSGRGRCDLRVGDLPAGPLVGGPVQAAGAGPADRHPGHRRRWCLRSGRLQRPVAAGVEGHHERGRAAPVGRTVAGRQTRRRAARRATHPTAGRLRARRPGVHGHRPRC
jgi:hypothetical protein